MNKFRRNLMLSTIPSFSFSTNVSPVIKRVQKVEWETVIGLEIHAQIASDSKLFSGSSSRYGSPVNTQVSYFDAGHPGTLPVLNRRCVEAGILTSLALGCRVNKKSVFDRKHYFYADLPVGYQITQQRLPLAVDGKLRFVTHNILKPNIKPYEVEARIKQIQLEQDSGKSMHDVSASCSLVDLNRAGVPLMEIVFEPDLKTSEEAVCLVNELKLIMLKLTTCNCRMEEGALRVDVNVSVNRPGEPLGVRTEIKNLNSVRSLASAVDYEVKRQIELLELGKPIENETRMFDSQLKKTVAMRDKEKVQDYRFMPEPNLPPLLLCDDGDDRKDQINIETIRRQLPELPEKTRRHLMDSYNLSHDIANQLVHEDVLLQSFNFLTNAGISVKRVVTFLLSQLTASLNTHQIEVVQCPVQPNAMLQLLQLEKDDSITIATFLQLIDMMVCGDLRLPNEIVAQNDWYQIVDEKKLQKLCEDVINDNSELINSKKRKETVYNTLVTMAKERSENRANIKLVCKIMKEMLGHN